MSLYKLILQSRAEAKREIFRRATGQLTWTAPLVKVQLCEYENQILKVFVAATSLIVQWPARIFHF